MKNLTHSLLKATGLSVKRKETRIYSRFPDSGTTDILSRFGDKYTKHSSTDIVLPTIRSASVSVLPGSALVIKRA
jgi:hypothetical protein